MSGNGAELRRSQVWRELARQLQLAGLSTTDPVTATILFLAGERADQIASALEYSESLEPS